MISLRPVLPSEVDSLLSLISAYYTYDHIAFDPPKQRAALLSLMDHPQYGESLFIQRGDEIVGYAVMTLDYSIEFGGLEAFIDEFFLIESARGQHIGEEAVRLIRAWCKVRNLNSLNVIVEHDNAPALRFYQRNGWSKPHRHYLSQPV
jgi:GNAT superfamily N-acetyltransferase